MQNFRTILISKIRYKGTFKKVSSYNNEKIMQNDFEELQAGILDGHFVCASWMAQRLSDSQISTGSGSVSMYSSTFDQSMPAPSRYVRVRKTPASVRKDGTTVVHGNEIIAFSSSGAVPSIAEQPIDSRLPVSTRSVRISGS